MKKIKRVLSVALASVMLLGMNVTTASAVELSTVDANTYKDANGFWTSLPFEKILTVDKNMNIPAGTSFQFSMEPVDVSSTDYVNNGGTKVTKGIDLDISTVSISYENADLSDTSITKAVEGSDSTVTTTKVGAFALPESFPNTGVYRYIVKEVVPDADYRQSYITYDTSDVYRVDLYVMSKEVQGIQYIGITNIVAVDITNPDVKDNIVFNNSIGSAGLTIEKVIEGSGKNVNDDFTFYIKIPEGGDNLTLNANTSFDAVIHHADNSTTNQTINVAGAKEGNVVVTRGTDGTYSTSTDGAQAFTLKGGESITFTNLPVGMIFYVTEANYTEEGYTTTAYYEATGTGANTASFEQGGNEGTQTKGTIAAGTNTMTFTNTKELTVDTGVNVDVLPYVLAMLLTVAGVILFVFKKRRNAR
jgi:hypothetical protein